MANTAQPLSDALVDLSKAITASNGADQELQAVIGWTAPPFSRNDLAKIVSDLAESLSEIDNSRINAKYDYSRVLNKVSLVKANSVPNLWNGNGLAASQAILYLVDVIEMLFRGPLTKPTPQPDWVALDEKDLLPKSLSKKLRSLRSQINIITEKSGDIGQQIEAIKSAFETAQSLPTDLEEIEEF